MDKRCTKICHLGDHYLFAVGEDRLWVGATVEDAGFDESVTEAGMEALLATARRLYPDLSRGDLRRSWCGLRPKALRRGGAYLHSRRPDGLVLLAGHYRNGILAGPRDADILAAEILGLPLREFSPFT
jgi:glycine oxidase